MRPSSRTPHHRTNNGVNSSGGGVQGLKAAQGISGFGEPGRVVAPHSHIHGHVFRQERDCAYAADREGAEFEFLYGGLRTKAPRVHRAQGLGRLPEHG